MELFTSNFGKFLIISFLILQVLASNADNRNIRQSYKKHQSVRHLKRREDLNSRSSDDKYAERNIFLRVKQPMKDVNATSEDQVQFKCKVDGWPKENLQYTWYKDNLVIDMRHDPRVTIVTRSWGSRLRIDDVFTLDTGVYRCEASNGYRRVHTSALLRVEFELPPPPSDEEKTDINFPTGKCEEYRGHVCGEYLKGKKIYVGLFENQSDMERHIHSALRNLTVTPITSDECRRYTLPAFCFFVFTPCQATTPSDVIDRGSRLCRKDCEYLKKDICREEIEERRNNKNTFLKDLFSSADCSGLPSSETTECVQIGLPDSNLDSKRECYQGNGENYRGKIKVTDSGRICEPWPLQETTQRIELLGRHNFCRNPGGVFGKPWCFVDSSTGQKETCRINTCEGGESMENFYQIIFISCASAGAFLLIFGITLICCALSRRRKNQTSTKLNKHIDNRHSSVLLLAHQNPNPTRIDADSVQLLSELGTGEFGKAYKGTIVNDPRFYEKQPFAFKVFETNHVTGHLNAFKREVEILSNFSHKNITNMKAISLGANNFNAVVLEYTSQIDLYEHLLRNSPNVETEKSLFIPADPFHKRGIQLETVIKMALQIGTGMEYLESNKYVHPDLATRNILVYENMELKVSTLGVVNNSYLSCYYKNSRGQLVPIRWMAPESLQSWQFSDKSTVWSFGVLLWEMFSYGMQPYCGYSNQEVLDMISRRQLLSCPDQCPAKIYSLMLSCWSHSATKRPNFKNIVSDLNLFLRSHLNLSSSKEMFMTMNRSNS